jgi:hypothetical protein
MPSARGGDITEPFRTMAMQRIPICEQVIHDND